MPDLLCYGEVLWDVYKKGNKTEKTVGGAPFNVAAVASILEVDSVMITAVGKDKNGHALLEEMNKLNVHVICQVNEKPTGRAVISLGKGKKPTFKISGDSAYDYIRWDQEMSYIATKAKVFCFGTLAQRKERSRKTLRKLLDSTGAKVIYDFNFRKSVKDWKKIFYDSLRYADILKMNEAELVQIMRLYPNLDDERDVLDLLCKEHGIKKIFITRSERGASLYTNFGHYMHAKAPKKNVVDTTGCGDAFTAAIVSGVLNGLSNKSLLEYATKLAARVTEFKGAIPDKLA